MANPRLLVEIAASLGSFREDMGKAAAIAEANANRIDRAFSVLGAGIKGALAGIAAGISVGAFVELVRGAIDAQEELALLGARAGITGSQLSALLPAAKLSHTGLEDVVQMSARLSKALLEAQVPTSKQAALFEALGVSAKDLPGLLADPVAALRVFAKAINDLPETSGSRAAAQLEIIGRSGGTTAAFLKELASQTSIVATRTNEEIEAAKAFNDRLVLNQIAIDDLKTKVVNGLLPGLTGLTNAFTEFVTKSGGARDAIAGLAREGSIEEWSKDAAIGIAKVTDFIIDFSRAFVVTVDLLKTGGIQFAAFGQQLRGVARLSIGDLGGFEDVRIGFRVMTEAGRDWAKELDNLVHRETFAAKVREQFAKSGPPGAPQGELFSDRAFQQAQDKRLEEAKRKEKALADAIKRFGARGDDPAKQLLQAQLDALKSSSAEEKAILKNNEDALEEQFRQGNIAIADYYARKQAAQDQDLRVTTENYVAEIAAIDAFIKQAQTAVDRAFGEKLKVEATGRQRLAIIAAAGDANKIIGEQTRAMIEYRHTLDGVNAQMLELEGNTAAAAKIRFDDQNEDLRRRLSAVIDSPQSSTAQRAEAQIALDRLSRTQDLIEKQARLNEITRDYGNITATLDITQRRIDIARQSGAVTELEALAEQAGAAKAMIPILEQEAARYEAIAQTLSGPAKDAFLIGAQQMRLKVEELGLAADAVGDKFRDAFKEPLTDAISSFVTGAKSIKDAFNDLVKSIEKNLADIAAKNVAEQLFGKGGFFGKGGSIDLGSIFGNLFGVGAGSKAEGGGASAASSLAMLAAPSASAAAGLTAITPAALAAAAALQSVAASSIASGAGMDLGTLSNLLADVPGFASGGSPPIGRASIVGERGPELFVPRAAGTIIPNDVLMARRAARGNNITVNVNVLPGASTETAHQAARRTGAEVQRALRR